MSDYDPVARREYYLRTRELQGRKPASEEDETKPKRRKTAKEKADAKALSEIKRNQTRAKSNQNYARAQVSKEIGQKRQKEVAQIRALATAKRDELTKRFNEAITKLTAEAKQKEKALISERDSKLAKVAADRKAKFAAVPDIPENVSPAMYEKLRLRRIKKIRKIRGDAAREEGAIKAEYSNKLSKASKEASDKQRFVRAITRNERERIRTQLTTSLDDAKKRYETLKQGLGPKA